MKKTIFPALAIAALLLGPLHTPTARAQIFLDDSEMTGSIRLNDLEQLPSVPDLDQTDDQYAPVGGGVVALGLFGGAYLLVKGRRKETT